MSNSVFPTLVYYTLFSLHDGRFMSQKGRLITKIDFQTGSLLEGGGGGGGWGVNRAFTVLNVSEA